MSKSELSRIEAAIQRHISDFFGDRDDLHFVVGTSGGVDSMSLLYAFYRLNISAYIVHVNYQKRGKESDKDARLVARMAGQWNYNYSTVEVDPGRAKGQNFQQWARDRRYRLFDRLARRQQADGIAVAHHRDDQVETILQKMFRGGGLSSWSSMQVWDGRLFRPLLNISRDEITVYAEKYEVPFRTDESNLDSDFARNFLRNEWLAELSDFFPGWEQNVLRISKQARQYEQAIGWIAGKITNGQGISRDAFHSLDRGVQKAVILFLLKRRKPGIHISRTSLGQLDTIERLQTGKGIQLTEKYVLMRDRKHYRIVGTQPEYFHNITLRRENIEGSVYRAAGLSLKIDSSGLVRDEEMLCMDPEKISWPVTLRRWKEGDRFQPLGMEGHQLVSDHLTNRKVSAARKHRALVLESFEETICAVIFPAKKNSMTIGTISERVKYDADTQQCLKIRYSG